MNTYLVRIQKVENEKQNQLVKNWGQVEECIAFVLKYEDFWQDFDNMSDMSDNMSDVSDVGGILVDRNVVRTIGNDFGAGSMELEKGQLCLNLMGVPQVIKERVNVLERVRVMEQKIKKESVRDGRVTKRVVSMKTDGGERMSPSRKSKSKGPVKLRVNLAHLGQLLGKTESPSSSSRVIQGLPC